MFINSDSRFMTSKECPSDFPLKLRKYWKGYLEYSLTPIQCGWIQYYSDREKERTRALNKYNKK